MYSMLWRHYRVQSPAGGVTRAGVAAASGWFTAESERCGQARSPTLARQRCGQASPIRVCRLRMSIVLFIESWRFDNILYRPPK